LNHSPSTGFLNVQILLMATACNGAAVKDRDAAAPEPDAPAGDATRAACEGVDAGAGAAPQYLDMDITGSGFAEHEGQAVLLVIRTENSRVLGVGKATVAGGGFALHFPKGYRRASNQEILWLVDADGDDVCNAAAGDHTGYLVAGGFDPVGSAAFAVAISDNHVNVTPREPNLCDPALPFGTMLNFNVTGSGFAAHDGRTVHLLTRTATNGAIFGSGAAVVSGGGFTFYFRRGYERFTYQEIFWFVDVDGDGTCVAGTDHTGYITSSGENPTQDVSVEMAVTDNHATQSARQADVCIVMNGCPLAP
jgi:hypothetical protein